MEDLLIPGIIALVTAFLTTIITQVFVNRRQNHSIKDGYKKLYLDKQLVAYQELWQKIRPLSRFYGKETIYLGMPEIDGKNAPISRMNASKFCFEITDFFFSEHGLLISKDTRNAFFTVRSTLAYTLRKHCEDEFFHPDPKLRNRINREIGLIFQGIRTDTGLLDLVFDTNKIGITESKNQ